MCGAVTWQIVFSGRGSEIIQSHVLRVLRVLRKIAASELSELFYFLSGVIAKAKCERKTYLR